MPESKTDDALVYRSRSEPAPSGDPLEYVMSDASLDSYGDSIAPDGWELSAFRTHAPALFNHNPNQIIGGWTHVRVENSRLVGRLKLAEQGTSPFTDYIRGMVRQGFLRAVSVGFRALKKEPLDAKKPLGGIRYLKAELRECSLVAVPANSNALAISRSLNPNPAFEALVFGLQAEENPRPAAVHGLQARHLSSGKNIMTATLSARIRAAHDTYNSLRDRLGELVNLEEPSADDTQRADELPAEIEAAQNEIVRLERQERALAASLDEARPAEPKPAEVRHGEIMAPERRPFALAQKKVDPSSGEYVYRALAAWAASQGAHEPLENVLRDRYKNDESTAIVLRAAVNPAMTTVAGWAQELVQTSQQGFLDRLLPTFIYPRLAAAGNKYTFSNTAGLIKIPTRTTTQTLAGAWVGEAAPKPVKRLSFSSITLTPYKLAVISTFSEEMALYSTPAIESIIRDAMSNDTGISLDTYLIDANAASSVRPAGLLNGVTPIAASTATTSAEKMVADIAALVNALVAAGSSMANVYLLVNPAQAVRMGTVQTSSGDFLFDSAEAVGNKFGVTVISSATVPAGRVIAIDASELATATGDQARFAVSNEATLHEEDTTPLALSAVGTPNTVAAPMRSLFQTDSIAIRMSLYVTWAMRRVGMVQTIAAVTW